MIILDKLNKHDHEANNKECKICEIVDPYYEHSAYKKEIYKFPKPCTCGGLIHCDSWGFDDGIESSTSYVIQCDKCFTSKDLYLPDDKDEFVNEMEEFKKYVDKRSVF